MEVPAKGIPNAALAYELYLILALLCAWLVEKCTLMDPSLCLPVSSKFRFSYDIDSAGYSMSSCPNQVIKTIPKDFAVLNPKLPPSSTQALARTTEAAATLHFGAGWGESQPLTSRHKQELVTVVVIAQTLPLVMITPLPPQRRNW